MEDQEVEDIDLTPKLNEEALNRAFRGYRLSGLPKMDIDTHIA